MNDANSHFAGHTRHCGSLGSSLVHRICSRIFSAWSCLFVYFHRDFLGGFPGIFILGIPKVQKNVNLVDLEKNAEKFS